MKKFLALVLALVMTMSLVTISAGAEDFTDDASITYEEAVDVMTACGVVGGYADGSFNPQGTLTRGAAAKIICNMILGPTEAGALATVEAPTLTFPLTTSSQATLPTACPRASSPVTPTALSVPLAP